MAHNMCKIMKNKSYKISQRLWIISGSMMIFMSDSCSEFTCMPCIKNTPKVCSCDHFLNKRKRKVEIDNDKWQYHQRDLSVPVVHSFCFLVLSYIYDFIATGTIKTPYSDFNYRGNFHIKQSGCFYFKVCNFLH